MKLVKIAMILVVGMTAQSCRIEMPSLVDLLKGYNQGGLYSGRRPVLYDFRISGAIRAQRGFKDTLLIGDGIKELHGLWIQEIMDGLGIPRKNTVYLGDFGYIIYYEPFGNKGLATLVSDEWEEVRQATRVVYVPAPNAIVTPHDIPRIAANNILFVLAAGNVSGHLGEDRDLYNINHVWWNSPDPDALLYRREDYLNLLKVHDTGKVVAATSVAVTETGIEPWELSVDCGDIKKSCFALVPHQPTSAASARLAAMAFYLSQFYPTVEEVVETLEVCAIDIGEPGVDREYGRGLANLLCPQVLEKELEVVSGYLEGTKEEFAEEKGGELIGTWEAENAALEVYIPLALKETVQTEYRGEINGKIEFTENSVIADFMAEATVNTMFLLPIEAYVTEEVRIEGTYEKETDILNVRPNIGELLTYTYTATRDSLRLVRHYP